MNILGLSYSQCYGTDDQKNSLTELKWEDMSGYFDYCLGILEKLYFNKSGEKINISEFPSEMPTIHDILKIYDNDFTRLFYSSIPKGFMTGREVLQYVGTNIFRKMYNNVWVDATLRLIQEEQPELAIIADVRFPNEVEGVQKAGGKKAFWP